MKKVYTALLLILLAAMFSVGVYSLADYDATGSVSEKREFVKPEFSVRALLDGTYIPALEQYYSDTFPGRETLLNANRTLNKFYYYSGSGEDSVLIEADSTSTITMPMRISGKVDSIVGMMESYTGMPVGPISILSAYRRPKPPRK